MTLLLGLLLVLEAASGAVLLFRPDIFRLQHQELFVASAGPAVISPVEALSIAHRARPDLEQLAVAVIDDVYEVRSATDSTYLDPATGAVLGSANPRGGFLGVLLNLHICAMSCPKYPGYLPVLAAEVPGVALTVGELLLAVTGLALVWWCVSGLLMWWPGLRRIATSLTIHVRRGNYRLNRDLHIVVGMAVLPFLLFWGITGAGYELPVIGSAWYAVTGGDAPPPRTFVSAPGTGPDIGQQRAQQVAAALAPHSALLYLNLPAPTDPAGTYTVGFNSGIDVGRFGGIQPLSSTVVKVDRRTAAAKITFGGEHMPVNATIWEKWNYGLHFGYLVPWQIRLAWLIVGLTPLLLTVTGLWTWHVRRTRKASGTAPRVSGTAERTSSTAERTSEPA